MKKFFEDVFKLAFVGLLCVSILSWPIINTVKASPTSNAPIYTISLVPGIPATVTDTTLTTIYTDGGNGSIIKGINVYSTDSVARSCTMSYVHGGTAYPIVLTLIPITAGSVTGTQPVNLMSPGILPTCPKDGNGNPSWQIGPNDSIKVQMSAVTAATAFTFVVINGETF